MSRTQNLCPQQMFRARANGETFVSATVTDAFKSRSYLEDFSVILYIGIAWFQTVKVWVRVCKLWD